MAFLVIGGFTIPVARGSVKKPPVEKYGALERADDGTLIAHSRGEKRQITFDLIPMTEVELLEAYNALVSYCAKGAQVWGFEAAFGLYSYKGLGPTAGFSGATTGTGGKFGNKLTLAATTGTITYATALPSRWTVMVWRFESGAWHHYAVRSDGAKWVDGVRNDAAATASWLSVSSGAVILANTSGAAQDYDDLVTLPCLIPATWPALVYASTRAFSQLPKLEVYGDAFLGSSSSAPLTMIGEVGESTYTPAKVGGGIDKTVQKLSVSLREV